MKSKALRNYRPTFEHLEERLNMTPTPIATVTLPGANSVWPYLVQTQASPIIADVDSDGRNEVIVPGGNGNVYSYEVGAGNALNLDREYTLRAPGAPLFPVHSTPVVVDMPRSVVASGRALFVAAEDGRVFGFDGRSGALLAGWPKTVNYPAHPTPERDTVIGAIATADLDRDGFPEIIVTSLNNEVTTFRTRDGSVMWRFSNDDTIFGAPAIGDLDRDGWLEVVIGGDSTASATYGSGGRINVLSHDGRRKWVKATDQVIQSSPVLVDLFGTGYLNIVVGTGLVYPKPRGHKIYALDHRGNDLPGWPYVTAGTTVEGRVYSSPAIADINGDGALDVVVSDAAKRIHVIGRDGKPLPGWPIQAFDFLPGGELYSSPIVADIDDTPGTDQAHVVLATGSFIRGFNSLGQQIWEHRDSLPHYASPAVGQLRSDGTWQMALIGNGLVSGQVRGPSFLTVFDIGATTLRHPWPQFRQDASNNVVVRPDSYSIQLITQLYLQELGRAPSKADLDNVWLPMLRNGTSLRTVIAALVSSREARAHQIDGWYRLYLGRPAEPAGLNAWLNALASGKTYAQVQGGIYASDESFAAAGGTNQAWVVTLYQKILGRSPRNGEEANWVNRLNTRVLTRTEVIIGFLRSREGTERQIRIWHAAYAGLGLQPLREDTLAAAGWDIRRGRLEEQVAIDFLLSNGAYAEVQNEASWIKSLYVDTLRRSASPADIARNIFALEGGTRLDALARSVARSREANIVILGDVYRKLLGRTPGGEIGPIADRLTRGERLSTILFEILSGEEYFNRAGRNTTQYIANVYLNVLDRPISQAELNSWNNFIAQGQNIRLLLPRNLLVSGEYYRQVIDQLYFKYLRHFPNTPADLGRVVFVRNPYRAQAWLDALTRGSDPRDLETVLLTSTEYITLARFKAFYTGSGRWLSSAKA